MTSESPIVFVVIVASLVLAGTMLAYARIRSARLFRGYEDLSRSAGEIRRRLENGRVVRDQGDIVLEGQFEATPFSIRFSHSESAPGMYIRCEAAVDFELSFSAKTPENSEGSDVYRVGNSVFDLRFVARTDNRIKAKLLLAQSNCLDQIQQLCCSNKTMLRLAGGSIELSEAPIPSDVAKHVVSHLESLLLLSRQVSAMPGAPRRNMAAQGRGLRWLVKPALAMGVAMVAGGWFLVKEPAKADANVHESGTQDIAAVDRMVIPNWSDWNRPKLAELNPEFVSIIKQAGVSAGTRLSIDAHGDGSSTSVAYFLAANADHRLRRVVWIMDGKVMCDMVGRIDGIALVPKRAMSGISWGENAAPIMEPDGDGLLVVRDHSNPKTATVYFIARGSVHSAIPEDFGQIPF
jgi:hypothetical protein